MPYSTVDLVKLVSSSIAGEQGGTAADLSPAQIEYEIKSAQATIDATLRLVYDVPFDKDGDDLVPFLIQSICTDIAAYGADLNYRKSREYDSENMPIIRRYNQANKRLNELRRGSITIDYTRTSGDDGSALVVHQYPDQLFTTDDWSEDYPRW